jgi:DNA processing protein
VTAPVLLEHPEEPEHAYAVAMATLDKVGPKKLRTLLEVGSPSECWSRLGSGTHPADPTGRWRSEVRRSDVGAVWRRHRAAGVGVAVLGEPTYPAPLATDPEAPAVLFFLGDPVAAMGRPRAAVIGTRSATRYGIGVAAQLGADLAAAGVSVVSGLALGVDGAAHEGSCAGYRAGRGDGAAPPLAVVAGGLDDPYPRRHAHLWRRVAELGAVLSECPLGRGNEQWRFPVRNRLLAALAHVVVVVECHTNGGSLHTVTAADRRGRPVGAVPGSIRSPSSAGANGLLADGAFPVRDVTDVLVALSLCGAAPTGPSARPERLRSEIAAPVPGRRGERPHMAQSDRHPEGGAAVGCGGRPNLGAAVADAVGAATHELPMTGDRRGGRAGGGRAGGDGDDPVWAALGYEPASIDELMRVTQLPLAEVAASLERLAGEGRASEVAGGWWCRP